MRTLALRRRIIVPLVAAVFAGSLIQLGVAQQTRGSASSTHAAALSDLYTLSSAVHQFRIDCDRYPTAKEGLKALRMCQPGLERKWRGPYLSKDVPKDPWGHSYGYKWPGRKGPKSFTLLSQGLGHGLPPLAIDGPQP